MRADLVKMQVLTQDPWKRTSTQRGRTEEREEGLTGVPSLANCLFPADIEKGCHFQHILACARLSVSPRLSEAVLQQVLELLEDQSDIISTMEHYYTAF